RTVRRFDNTSFVELGTGFHQVFPYTWCEKFEVDSVVTSSVLNHTPMGKRTEVVIDGQSPARYLSRVQSKSIMEDDEFDAVLASHEVDPELLHGADFDGFIRVRRECFVCMEEYYMNTDVIRLLSVYSL